MRITKAEKIILILTALFVLFAVGYRFGSARSAGAVTVSSMPGTAARETAKLDINTADIEALDALPGVGSLVAGEIIEYRQAHGKFGSVDELLNVPGVSQELLDMIKDRITAG